MAHSTIGKNMSTLDEFSQYSWNIPMDPMDNWNSVCSITQIAMSPEDARKMIKTACNLYKENDEKDYLKEQKKIFINTFQGPYSYINYNMDFSWLDTEPSKKPLFATIMISHLDG